VKPAVWLPASKLIASVSRPERVFSTLLAAAPMAPAAIGIIESRNALTTWMIFDSLPPKTVMVS